MLTSAASTSAIGCGPKRAPTAVLPRFDNLSSEELERIRRMIEEFESIEAIDDEMRDLVEKHWPWLVEKLPPRTVQ